MSNLNPTQPDAGNGALAVLPTAPPLSAKAADLAVGQRGVQLSTLDEMWRFAQFVVKGGFAPKSLERPESVLVAIQFGLELGMAPMAAIRSIAVIGNRPALWGDMMLALCLASPAFDTPRFREGFTGSDKTLEAFCEVARVRGQTVRRTFSITDAQTAGLAGKDTYKHYPRRMLQARARAFALRDTFPDVLQGVYAVEEIQDEAKGEANAGLQELRKDLASTGQQPAAMTVAATNGAPTIDAVVVEPTGTKQPPPDSTPLDAVRIAIRNWAQESNRPRPSDDECKAAIESFAKVGKLGPIAAILRDPDATSAFVKRAMVTTVRWEQFLPEPRLEPST